jgi:hypothetical protein
VEAGIAERPSLDIEHAALERISVRRMPIANSSVSQPCMCILAGVARTSTSLKRSAEPSILNASRAKLGR